ncbi:MAG: hypothetical protein N2556_03590, partial [Anaerolineae bacterium]|nr:hypothetical protein [Anaerolineae bacterium]
MNLPRFALRLALCGSFLVGALFLSVPGGTARQANVAGLPLIPDLFPTRLAPTPAPCDPVPCAQI